MLIPRTDAFIALRQLAIQRKFELKRQILDFISTVEYTESCILCRQIINQPTYLHNDRLYTRAKEDVSAARHIFARIISSFSAARGFVVCAGADEILSAARARGEPGPSHSEHETQHATVLCNNCLYRLHQQPVPVLDASRWRHQERPTPIALDTALEQRIDMPDVKAIQNAMDGQSRNYRRRELQRAQIEYKLKVLEEQIEIHRKNYDVASALSQHSEAECIREIHNALLLKHRKLAKRCKIENE
ncbi:hypothetical protein PAPHI01_2120 [Pancytospora philotis]|nr:hypothetical protein PAPHI01_2120 [Pancytospora philotis]